MSRNFNFNNFFKNSAKTTLSLIIVGMISLLLMEISYSSIGYSVYAVYPMIASGALTVATISATAVMMVVTVVTSFAAFLQSK